MSFDPNRHLMKVKGGATYLEVKWRLVWFREDHPDWGIETRSVVLDIEKGIAVFQAFIYNAEGRLIGSGTKSETARDFGDFAEKAESGAIGRALAVCGFGTQFAPEMEEGERIVDAPVQRQQAAPRQSDPQVAAAKPDTSSNRKELLQKVTEGAKILFAQDMDGWRAWRSNLLGTDAAPKDLTDDQLRRVHRELNALADQRG